MLAKPAAQGTVVHREIKATAMDACRMRDVCRLFRREESLTTPFLCFTGFSGQHHGNKFVVVKVLFPDPGRITAIGLLASSSTGVAVGLWGCRLLEAGLGMRKGSSLRPERCTVFVASAMDFMPGSCHWKFVGGPTHMRKQCNWSC